VRVSVKLTTPGGTTFDLLGRDLKNRKVAFRNALRTASRGLEKDLEAATEGAGLGRLARAWQSKTYPDRENAGSLKAAAIIYPQGGKNTQGAINIFGRGGIIRSGAGKYLAIPTASAPKTGTDGKRINPSNFPEVSLGRLRFVFRRGRPSLLVVDKRGAPAGARRGRSLIKIPASQDKVITMFILVPAVAVAKRFDIEALTDIRFRQIQAEYEREYKVLDRG
jgi:hypothetical protein